MLSSEIITSKMKFYIFICIIAISITSCKSKLESFLLTDINKDGLTGNVRSVETYAYKEIVILKNITSRALYKTKAGSSKPGKYELMIISNVPVYNSIDTLFEILTSKIIYNQKGNRVEYIEYQVDDVLASWKYSTPDQLQDSRSYRSKPQIIDDAIFKHLKYNYNKDNVLEGILYLNCDGSFKLRTEYHFSPMRRKIIDSTFYENRGLSSTKTSRLTKYGISEPGWVSNKSGWQFDIDNKIIVEGKIHYYYDEFDRQGNWIRCTKYYEGPTKENPVYLRRVIEYF